MDQRTDRNPFDALHGVEDHRASDRRWIRYVPGGGKTIVIGIAVLLVALLVWFIRPTQTVRPNRNFIGANQAMPVGIAKITTGDINVTLNALGTVTPLATVTVKPQVGGQLVKIDFTEGDTVRAGQVLAEIDPKPYQAALDQANGQLARDQAQLANAEVDLKRYQTLATQNSIAQQQVDTQAALVRQLQGVIKADQANVESAEINLNYATIRSPITGRVGLRQVDTGNLLTAGQATGIAVVTQLQPISVVYTVPEDVIENIMARVRQGAKLTSDAYDRAQSKQIATGTLATVDNQIDTTTGTVKLRAMFDNARGELFPNQFVNIKLLVDTLHNQTVAPASAIQRGASGAFVFVVNDDHTVSMRAVMVGQTEGDRVAVTSGLKSGDTVVVDGADRLRDGARVVLPGEQPRAASQQGRGPANANGRRGRRGGPGGGAAGGAAGAGGGAAGGGSGGGR
ncbi:MAG TPA: MdtA/MuxA family multidrug efflux RND transporter periplasmic adaptor subunit [Micropepsaceae bacterium]|nr:MdtA/MuxA family multidrug efflux RND transporter periplasmic adaptor subunit [Micropepsaceae bacterium]